MTSLTSDYNKYKYKIAQPIYNNSGLIILFNSFNMTQNKPICVFWWINLSITIYVWLYIYVLCFTGMWYQMSYLSL